jgi:hypothetical protein
LKRPQIIQFPVDALSKRSAFRCALLKALSRA